MDCLSSGSADTTSTIGGDLTVGRIGYGAMQFTGKQVWGDYHDREAATALLRGAVEAGVTFIDNYLRQSAHLSARRLGVEQLDLYYLHSGRATDAPFEEQVATLAALRDEGLIRHIGLSNVTLDQLRTAQTIAPIAAVTAHYNISARTGAELLRAAEESGAVFSPWHPVRFDEGGDTERVTEAVDPIARRHGATPQQIALAWHLHRSPVSLPIPGTTSPAHLKENLAAVDIELSADEVAALTALAPEA